MMELFKNIGKAVTGAVGVVGEKSRKMAQLNRIRTVIQCEEKAAEREYLALGRTYYNSLRDKNDAITEAHCAELDAIQERLDKALSQLEEFYAAEEEARSAKALDEEEGSAEEVTLDDVEAFDSDPMAEPAVEEAPADITAPAELDENSDLPFEG